MPGLSSIMEAVQGQRAAIARGIHHEIVSGLPGFTQLTDAEQQQLFGELDHGLGLTMDHLAAGEAIPETELAVYRDQGFRRGEAAFPFHDLVAAFHLASVSAFRMLWQFADPQNYREMFAVHTWTAREVPHIMDALVDGYMSACQQNGNEQRGRKVLIQLLLDAKPAAEAAAALGLTLAPSYLVLKCRLATFAPQPSQRKEMQAALSTIPGALTNWDNNRITVLIPATDASGHATQLAGNLVNSLCQISGQPVRAALAYRGTVDGIADAAAEADEVLTLLATVPDQASRAYCLDELLIEYAISRNTDVIKRLADQLAPLGSGTDLASTLETLYSCDLDRERTAQRLHIHRRTLTYRMNRIRQLCGIDPGTAHGIALLRAALTAKRMTCPAP